MKCRAMTRIMHICMVLMVVVSAFFYAPMEVRASDSSFVSSISSVDISSSGSTIYNADVWSGFLDSSSNSFDFVSDVLNDSYYEVQYTVDFTLNASFVNVEALSLMYGSLSLGYNPYLQYTPPNDFHQDSFSGSIVAKGSDLKGNSLNLRCVMISNRSGVRSVSIDYVVNILSVSAISSNDSDLYEAGYNAGYSDGEQVGYCNGYSQGFTDGEASVDTDAIYDEAFQAGKDSVDTQSYYDAGYQAGYQVAYSDGYESGYDVGYQDAMDRIANWGADISDYPKQMYSIDMGHTFSTNVTYSVPFSYRDSVKGSLSNVILNPNHTYKFDVEIRPYNWDSADTITYEDEFYFCIGGIDYPLSYLSSGSRLTSLFVPGDRMSDSYYLVWSTIRASVDGTNNICRVVCPYTITLYDMGPSGDTQNHIANQTDQLTNGYDSSQGAAVNDDFKASVNEYHTAEDSLFSTATTSLENFTFLDFTSITGMVTSLSFVTSIMTSIYMAMGGDTGASGIILAVLFSVMLVSMAIGLYRYYVSNGKSDGSGKGGD